MTRWFECVPNFSEGRDATKVAAIVEEARRVEGVTVLDVELNADHHRSVVTVVGPADPLAEAVFRMIRRATALIDLTGHRGEHPRMGATDVVPFVPLGEATMDEAAAVARTLADRVWRELAVPVYLYGEAAVRPDHRDLAEIRKGEFEGIRDTIGSVAARRPDVGEPRLHPTAGIVAIGARPTLIAYNAYLSTPDVAVAKRIAKSIRARDGGLAEVKALGFEIKERNRAQVSMNLTDFRKTPVHRALEQVRREAARYGATVEESEVVGLIPEDALLDAAEFYLQLNRFDRGTILERKVRAAEAGRGPELATATIDRFASRLAARTATPGGGSAAALAGALGVALAEMVTAYSHPADTTTGPLAEAGRAFAADRVAFLAAIDADAAAYDAVRTTRRALKAAPADPGSQAAYVRALEQAIATPLEVATRSRSALDRLGALRPELRATLESDRVTAEALLGAALVGALANARINLPDLEAAGGNVTAPRAAMDRLARPAT